MSELARAPEEPIRGPSDLTDHFRQAEKRGAPRRLGLELELSAVRESDLAPATFEGPGSVSGLLARLVLGGRWRPITETSAGERRIVGLARLEGGDRLTLEPGGQVELALAPHGSLGRVVLEARARLDEVLTAADAEGIALLGGGLQPLATLDAIGWVPKQRYTIMRELFEARGGTAHAMMKKTQSIQVSLDWDDEEDGARRLRAALLATPVLAALAASSPIEEGRPTGLASRRLAIWETTDEGVSSGRPPAGSRRTGFVAPALLPGFGYDAYATWAQGLEAILRVVDGHFSPAAGCTFGEILARGSWPDGHAVTRADWLNHLTTVFTHARWKSVIELRMLDAPLPEEAFATPALVVGLLDEREPLDATLSLLGGLDLPQLEAGMADVARRGLRASVGGTPVGALARMLLALGRRGLEDRVARRLEPAWVPDLLLPLERRVEVVESPADELLRLFQASGRDPRALVARLRHRKDRIRALPRAA